MNIIVNGEYKNISSVNMKEAMSELGYEKLKCATALTVNLYLLKIEILLH